ncbi:MAG TPA: restriction endonuclease subunit S [Leucothrix mucor]|uniref:Restriction endonuclease subunit S n=1 Tax=Leucothrix mucor TaxID=45248 RepID=A0A7V2T1B8_LEUMU|nr:restriction endonuclease subunit S [Leucothrix mucor]
MSWTKVELSSFITIKKGKKHNTINSKTKSSVRYLQIEDLRNDNNIKYTDDVSGIEAKKTDVIIAWDGANAGTIGFKKSGFIGSTLARISFDIKKVNTEYFGRFLQGKFVELRSNCTGATIPHISRKHLVSLKIPLPPLKTQKYIASVLEKADQLRKNCQRLEQELNQLAQSVFIEMFGDPVTNPKGWEETNLGEKADLLAGFAFKSKEYSENPRDVKLCRGINIFPDRILWKNVAYWNYIQEKKLEKYELNKGDIVIAMDRPWISTGFKIAQIQEKDLPSLLLQRVMRVRGRNELDTCFFYYALNQQAFLKHSMITETTVPHISPKDVTSYKLPSPSNKKLVKFHKIITNIQTQKKSLLLAKSKYEENFNSLSQKAFKGELKAPA